MYVLRARLFASSRIWLRVISETAQTPLETRPSETRPRSSLVVALVYPEKVSTYSTRRSIQPGRTRRPAVGSDPSSEHPEPDIAHTALHTTSRHTLHGRSRPHNAGASFCSPALLPVRIAARPVRPMDAAKMLLLGCCTQPRIVAGVYRPSGGGPPGRRAPRVGVSATSTAFSTSSQKSCHAMHSKTIFRSQDLPVQTEPAGVCAPHP